jgi:hypothetical protein
VLAQAQSAAGPLGALALPSALREAERADAALETLRWSVRVPRVTSDEIDVVAARVRAAAQDWARGRPVAQLEVTGTLLRVQRMQLALTATLASSMGLNVAVTLVLFLLTARGLHELAAALLVNLLPVGAALAAAWIAGFRLDAATVMVSSVILGLAVDNTFHLFHAAGHDRGRCAVRRVARAFERVGPPATTASLALVLGFGVLTLSGFRPTARFGGLAAFGIAAALVSTLLTLPAVWARVPRPRR